MPQQAGGAGGEPAGGPLVERPEIYAKSAPMLRCSGGRIFSQQRADGSSVYMAFFEWNIEEAGSVLEAFRHMPEECMGAIGLRLVEKAPPLEYEVDGERLVFDHTVFRDPSSIGGLARLPGEEGAEGEILHAFKAVWVSGLDARRGRDGLFGHGQYQLRAIRMESAWRRFRPAYARVVQGAVRGVPDPELAWSVFESAMLKDLRMSGPHDGG